MNLPSRYLRAFGISASLLFGAIATVNWQVDPLQHYRAAQYPALLVEQERFRLPGIARHSNADVIIEGTSISAGQSSEEAGRILGGKALNLSMQGASAHEQSLLLRLALKNGAAKRVIWDVNFEYLRGKPDWVSDYDGAFPGYLFDDNAWNDIPRYLLNIDTSKNSARVIAQRMGFSVYPIRSVESFRRFNPNAPHGPAAIAKSMERRRKNPEAFRALLPQFTAEQLAANFEANYANLIRSNPTVHFDLYFPPFSSAYFDFIREIAPELIPVYVAFRQDIFARCLQLPNVTLHDPQSDLPLIQDLERYRDPIHFDGPTHTLILEGIKASKWKTGAERLEAFRAWLNSR